MAGIGFKLKRILSKEFFLTDLTTFLYSVLITAGPWIISSISLLIIFKFIGVEDRFFVGSTAYSFIFSMVLSGGFSFLIIRVVADLTYEKKYAEIYRNYSGAIILIFIISAILSALFFTINDDYTFQQKFLASYLFVVLSLIWTQTIFLSATEDYRPAVFSFVSGFSIAVLLAYFLKKLDNGTLISFDVGMGFILFLQNIYIVKSFKRSGKPSFYFLKNLRKYPQNLFIGFLYYFSVWIDDIIAWFKSSEILLPGFRFSSMYDLPMFVAYLFIIPALSMFVLQIETEFYLEYRRFFMNLEQNKPLRNIVLQKKRMKDSLLYSIKNILIVQLSAAFIGLLLSSIIGENLGFSNVSLYIFRLGIIGASFNSLFLTLILINLYFDFRGIVLESVVLTFGTNFIVSMITFEEVPGLGFVLAFFLGTLYIFLRFYRRYKELIFYVYITQPTNLPKSKKKILKLGEEA
jgi:uncharacterized membrane protein